MSIFSAVAIAAAAFLCGGISSAVYLGLKDDETEALADAVLEFQTKYGTKNRRSYRLDQLLERHGRLNAVSRRRRELAIQQWIPVGERLPQDNVAVLVNHDPGGVEMAFRQDGQWGISHTNVLSSGCAYTHWMPLPAPPTDAK